MSSVPVLLASVAALEDRAPEWQAAREAAVVTEAADLGLLTIDGADAESFLQAQLSNDVAALAPGRAQWTSYNSPKGRMLATLFLVRQPADGGYLALLAKDLAAPIAKRLSMFVLRSKVALADATPGHRLLGVGGPRAATAIEAALGSAPAAGEAVRVDDALIVHLPDGRLVVIATADRAADLLDAIARHATPVGAAVWSWLAVRSGVPMLTAATQEQFVAQTANWDAIGGLDFRKGCYPGQEIVARTQYLGRLKERLFAFRSDADPPAPGTRLFGETFGDQASGTVVNSAPAPEGGTCFLAVAQTSAVEGGPLALGAPGGPRARRAELPYPLPEPAAPRERLK